MGLGYAVDSVARGSYGKDDEMPNLERDELEALWAEIAHLTIPVVQRYRRNLESLTVERKEDSTFLTDADSEVQALVVAAIRSFDVDGRIVAEEASATDLNAGITDASTVWVVDPIDGTSQFIRAGGKEFCTAVAVTVNGDLHACLIVVYELAVDGGPLWITANTKEHTILVNGRSTVWEETVRPSGLVSMTRSSGRGVSPLESAALAAGLNAKNKSTSQTIDIVRTTPFASALRPKVKFDYFYREYQKIWDGIPGMCLAVASKLAVTTLHPGQPFLPLRPQFVQQDEPTFRSTLIGPPDVVALFESKFTSGHPGLS